MHPGRMAKLNLRSDGDVAIFSHLEGAVGTMQAERLIALIAPVLADAQLGRLAPADVPGKLEAVLGHSGVETGVLDQARHWYGAMQAHIDTHGGPPPVPAIDPAAAKRELAELDQAARQNMGTLTEAQRYRQFDLIAAVENTGSDAAPPAITASEVEELRRIEGLMGDPRSAYNRGPDSQKLQARWRELVGRGMPAEGAGIDLRGVAAWPTTDPEPVMISLPGDLAGRRAELEAMMGDPRSDYYRGPRSTALRSEFRSIVAAQLPAAPAIAAHQVASATSRPGATAASVRPHDRREYPGLASAKSDGNAPPRTALSGPPPPTSQGAKP